MPASCCVVGCGSRAEKKNVKFYRIPSATNFKHREDLNSLSLKRKQAWLSVIRRQDFTESRQKNARICSNHFISGHPAALTDSCNPDWIPTLKMDYEKQQHLSEKSKRQRYNRKEERFGVRSEMVHCAAKNCTSSTNNGMKLFRFPSDEKMRLNWIKICQRDDSWSPTRNSRLCSLHFSEDQFMRSRSDDGSTNLKANALPTISVEDIRDKNQLSNCVFLPENLYGNGVINDVTFISAENYDEEKVCDETSFLLEPVIEVQNGFSDTEKSIANESSKKLRNGKSEEIIIKIEPDHDESLVEKYESLKQEHDDLKRKYETLQKLYTEERGKIALLMLLVESGRCSNKQLQDILKMKK